MFGLIGTIFSSIFLGGVFVKEGMQKAARKDEWERHLKFEEESKIVDLYEDMKKAKDRGLVYDEAEQRRYMNCIEQSIQPRKIDEQEAKEYDDIMKKFNNEYVTYTFYADSCLNKTGGYFTGLDMASGYNRVWFYKRLYENAGYYWSSRVERDYSKKKYCANNLCEFLDRYK